MKRILIILAAIAAVTSLSACEKNITAVLPDGYWCSYLRPTTQKLYAPSLGDTISITENLQFWYVCADGMPDTTTKKP